MMNKMTVLRVRPWQEPEVVEILNTLDSLQEEVGGYIQATYPFKAQVAVICNEEGKCTGLRANRGVFDENGVLYDILCGTFLVVGLSEGDFCSLKEEDKEKFLLYYRHPEMFRRSKNGLQSYDMVTWQEMKREEGGL